MTPISRKVFLQQCIGLGATAGLSLFFPSRSFSQPAADELYQKIVLANAKAVEQVLTTLASDLTDVRRRLGYDLANLAAAFSEPTSSYYQQETLLPYMRKISQFLVKAQNEDGTLDLGNLASPPDTAFILEPLCAAAAIVNTNHTSGLEAIKNDLNVFILKAGEALRTGGVHTPNHRWVISAALAKINALYPNAGYVKRIDEWLSEGIFMDQDGHYLERSMIYSEVIDRSLITIARQLNRPQLFSPVRKNLALTYYYMEPNGDLVTNDSRRQDQFLSVTILPYYLSYRFMAIHDKNQEFAAIATQIENGQGFSERVLPDLLPFFLEEPIYKKALPSPQLPPVVFEKFFKDTNLVRIRHNDTTTTLFGGADFPIQIASGRSNSPNFFAFRKGAAILSYLRFSTDFFNTGYFHSQGISHSNGQYVLHHKLEAPYYQPLPPQFRRADGNYKHSLSTDGRFWNKMDFEHRPQSNIQTLDITIDVSEKNGVNELKFMVDGTRGVHLTIEFCFKEGGQLTGIKPLNELQNNYALESSTGTYRYGNDTITFGPGVFQHTKLSGLEGELYSSHFGSLRTAGMHVFCTGLSPFVHTLTIG